MVGDPNESSVLLTVVVTAQSEGPLLRPTIRSVSKAVRHALSDVSEGEILIVLHRATALTSREAERWKPMTTEGVPVRVLEVSEGDRATSRNAGVREARGAFVAFCDGADLISSDFFSAGLVELQKAGAREAEVLHPEIVVTFGATASVSITPFSEEVDFLDLVEEERWPSVSIAARELYRAVPFRECPVDGGFGHEDQLWNIETSIAGLIHRSVPRTMHFKRVRGSAGGDRHDPRLLPPFDISALRAAMPSVRSLDWQRDNEAPPRVPRNVVVRALKHDANVARDLARRFLGVARRRMTWVVQALARRLVAVWHSVGVRLRSSRNAAGASLHQVRSVAPGTRPRQLKASVDFGALQLDQADGSVTLDVLEHLMEASTLEPALSRAAAQFRSLPRRERPAGRYALVLADVVRLLGENSRAIVAVPWVGIGGADSVSLNYARALAASSRFAGSVTVFATTDPSRSIPQLIPEAVRFVQMPPAFQSLTSAERRTLLAQALMLAKPELVVSVNCFDLSDALQRYWRPLTASMRIYVTIFAWEKIGPGYPTNPITDDSDRQYVSSLAGIITDNSVTAQVISDVLAVDPPRLQVHYQPVSVDARPSFRESRAFNDGGFNESSPFRVLWPHRLDREKRPDVLIGLGRRLRELGLPVVIEVHGRPVLSGDADQLIAALKREGVRYRGPYAGGLSSIPAQDYHALLLTSEWEGLPLAVVESMFLGVPVVSTPVGGVLDLVRHGETGLLVADPEDIEGYVASIRLLLESLADRRRFIVAAYEAASSRHDWRSFVQLVEAL